MLQGGLSLFFSLLPDWKTGPSDFTSFLAGNPPTGIMSGGEYQYPPNSDALQIDLRLTIKTPHRSAPLQAQSHGREQL